MLLLVTASVIISTAAAALPPGWKPCSKSSPDHNECVKNQIQLAIHSLAKGIPELNIGPLEPFPIKDLALAVNTGFNLTMDTGTIHGFTNITITEVESKPWTSMHIKLIADLVKYNFNYTARGNIFNIKVRSSGEALITLVRVSRDLMMKFSEYKKDGKTYLNVKELNVVEIPEDFIADFHPKGRGYDYRLMINKIINDNWKVLLEEQQRAGYTHSKLFYTGLINNILSKIPKEDFDMP